MEFLIQIIYSDLQQNRALVLGLEAIRLLWMKTVELEKSQAVLSNSRLSISPDARQTGINPTTSRFNIQPQIRRFQISLLSGTSIVM